MGILVVFAAGYVLGSRSGEETLDGVVDALQAIRQSEEFHDLVKAVRVHAAHSLRSVASIVERARSPVPGASADDHSPSSDLVDRFRLIVGRR